MASDETLPPDGVPLQGGDDADEDAPLLEGKLDNVKWLVDALSCIYSAANKGQDVTITVPSQGGLRFSLQQAGVLHASVLIPRVAFSQFRSEARDAGAGLLTLRLNLSLIMECLGLFAVSSSGSGGHHGSGFGDSTGGGGGGGGGGGQGASATVSLHVWYEGEGHPLCLRLWDGDAHTDCRLTTLAADEEDDGDGGIADLGFYEHDVVTSCIVESELLRDALSELSYCGATSGELRLSPTSPNFVLRSPAEAQDGLGTADALCTVQLPAADDRLSEAFQQFECKRAQVAVYKLQHLARCARGLGLSRTCRLRVNAEGMLAVECRIKGVDIDRRGGGLDRCFVEFVIVAQEIEDDEDDEDEGQRHQDGERDSGALTPNDRVRRRLREMDMGDEDNDEDEDEDDEVAGTPPSEY